MSLNARLAVLLALPSLAACGTLRLYEGPERPRDQVARVHEMSAMSNAAFFDFSHAEIVDVDGHDISGHSEDTIELLPGPHVLHATAKIGGTSLDADQPGSSLEFTAQPGGDYELWLGLGGHVGVFVSLMDTATQKTLADSNPTAEELRSATFDLDGRNWLPSDWHCGADVAQVDYVLSGQSEQGWDEMLIVMVRRTGKTCSDAMPEGVEKLQADIKRQGQSFSSHVAATDADATLLEWEGQPKPELPVLHGFTLFRCVEGRVHQLGYAAFSADTFRASEARWQQAFRTAQLRSPWN